MIQSEDNKIKKLSKINHKHNCPSPSSTNTNVLDKRKIQLNEESKFEDNEGECSLWRKTKRTSPYKEDMRWKRIQRNFARNSSKRLYCPHTRLKIFLLILLSAINAFCLRHFGANATLMSNEHSSQNGNDEQSIHWEENSQYNNEHPPKNGINTSYISQILDRLTDGTIYDKRLRPRYSEGAVDVGISIHITSISAVSEVDMDFTLDFYLRQTWYDNRLAFAQIDPELARRIKKLTVGVEYLDRLWKPDTFFPNEKTSMFHVATTPNTFLRIEPDGRIYTSQRMTVKAMCPMDLAMFPMDSQTCKLGLESYGYDVDDIDYYWGERRSDGKKSEDAVAFDEFFLPQFRAEGYRVTGTHVRTASGEYARLYIEVVLSRNLGFYLMNIIIPSMLIVSISWVSFWLSREASPARVGLGVTTVLTMTTLITTTNNSMPKVSYIKGLDVFLNFCFVMVFASLVEYAIVSYWNKRQCRRRDRRERIRSAPANANVQRNESSAFSPGNIMAPSGTEYPMFMNIPTTPAGGLAVPSPNAQSYVYKAPGLLVAAPLTSNNQHQNSTDALNQQLGTSDTITTQMPISPECDCRLGNIPLLQYPGRQFQNHSELGLSSSIPYGLSKAGKTNRRQKRRPYSYYGGMSVGTFGMSVSSRRGFCLTLWACRRLNPSKIDRLSRCCFPLLFLIFNILYWSALTFLSQHELGKTEYVPF
uniref:Gamma-aminobutyric acid receptor subunit beta n=1 Tax=Meloidogyne incognita TaxID=6306 RepID=A0A914L402_MELIC